jgi:hypothetical protein
VIPVLKRATQCRRNRPGASADFDHAPVRVVPHDDPARVARQALRRSRGNAHAVLEGRLSDLIRIREDRGVERPEKHGAHLRRDSPADHHHAVVVVKDMERAALVLPRTLVRFGLPVHVPPAADDALDVNGGAGARNSQELLFRLRRRHASSGAPLIDLGGSLRTKARGRP